MDGLGALALAATVLVVAALAAGIIERAPLSFPMIFMGLGLALGGTGSFDVELDGPLLETVGVITLALVLFLDAMHLELAQMRNDWHVPALTLGPGTILVVAAVGGAAMLLLDLEPVPAFVVGAVLASTDPVVIRDVIRDRRLPAAVRRAVGIEAGTNDLVVLPAVLILSAVAGPGVSGATDWVTFLVRLILVGPAAGVVVGIVGARLMAKADARFGIRREYQALYGIGLVLAAYVAGETLGTDGFLAAFAAGIAVTLGDQELCDCFLEFGQVLSEMLMLFAFVLFGAVLATSFGGLSIVSVLVLAVIVVFVIRPVVISLVLLARRRALSLSARAFIAWFGPRGLNSLLLTFIAVRAGMPGGEALFATVGLVVTVSVFVHGASATPLAARYARRVAAGTTPEEQESTVTGLFRPSGDTAPRIEPDELARLLEGPVPPVVLDVRRREAYEREAVTIPSALRVMPDDVARWAADQTRDRLVVLYCT